jgi:Heavy metal binding domain
MKKIIIAGIALAVATLWVVACQNNTSKNTPATATADTKYLCPMNCEKGKTYTQPGTCPVCNMDLELAKTDAAAATTEYFMNYRSEPAQIEAGKPATLNFTPKIKGNESAAVPLDLVHEKKMHLILVNDDLSWFDHLHPAYQADGAYQVKSIAKGANFTNGRGGQETRFESGGKFWAFADYKPTGGLNTVNKIELNIAGTAGKTAIFGVENRTCTVDGYTLKLSDDALSVGKTTHLDVTITQNGKPLDLSAFENYLGEKAHVIMVETESKAFLHTHPGIEHGQLHIHTTFANAGTYRAWLQFKTEGKVHTADFVLKVQ